MDKNSNESATYKLNIKLGKLILMLSSIQHTKDTIEEHSKSLKKIDHLIAKLTKCQIDFDELIETVSVANRFLKTGKQHHIDTINYLLRVRSDVHDELIHAERGKAGFSRNKLLRHFFSDHANKGKADWPTSWFLYACSTMPEFRDRFNEPSWSDMLAFFKDNPKLCPPLLNTKIKPGALATRITRYIRHCRENHVPLTIVMSKARYIGQKNIPNKK